MSNAALVRILDGWAASHECDPDSSFLTRYLVDRDEEAFASLVRRHGSLVYGTCHRMLGNRADTDDAFQAVFFVLARRAHTLKPDRGVGPWLHGVALRVAKKLRARIARRRVREMSAAKSERVEAAEPDNDFWAAIDEELARMSPPLSEVLLLCDLGGLSHSQAARSLGVAKGTVTKRLAKAREGMAARLKRRGIALGAGASSSMAATRATASVPPLLLRETAKQAAAFGVGGGVGSLAVRTLAEGVMRSLEVGVLKMWLLLGLLATATAGAGLLLAGGPGEPGGGKGARPKADPRPAAAKAATVVMAQSYTVEYPGTLPVSVAFSADGKTLLTGDTGGEVMSLIFAGDELRWRWKAKVGGSHAAVAFSADQKEVYATTEHGVRVLDAERGKGEALIAVKDSNPTAIGVFPNRTIAGTFIQSRIVFGNPRVTFVKTWADGKLADTLGTIETGTVPKGAKPADGAPVPLAVDPKGRSAIVTGPRDAKGQNVLWAYACGDHGEGSPGNRVMVGHAATVVCAAWAKEGGTAVTGDAGGCAIVWDAKTMKEVRRVDLGGRIVALAISDDGRHTAAYVLGKPGGDLYVWETATPAMAMKPIHTELADLGTEPRASLAFSPDGRRLAGCAIDKKWLTNSGELVGKVRVWEHAAAPKVELPPKFLVAKQLPEGSSANFVILDDHSILLPSENEGAVDFRNIADGTIQARIVLGKFAIGRMRLSSDRKWLAMERLAPAKEAGVGVAAETFEVGVYDSTTVPKATIPSCSRLLDVASGGKVVAVVRGKKIELWDIATSKLVKAAPFGHTRIDAAGFSPDGKLLAVSDRNALVLWRWGEDTHERIDLGRRVGSLAFSPDAKFLAEGPTPRDGLRIREVATGKVVRSLADGTGRPTGVPRMAYARGGRVLIACDDITPTKKSPVPHRINLWDTADGSLAHQIALPAGPPYDLAVSPNGRHLVATLDDGDSGIKLSVWRLDGKNPPKEPVPAPPATARPR